jgi:hypothetical protein
MSMEMQRLDDQDAPVLEADHREWDMVLVFPIADKGALRSFEEFAASMLGLKWVQMVNKATGELVSKGAQKVIGTLSAKDLATTDKARVKELNLLGVDRFQDSAQEVFKTDRCFMNDAQQLSNTLRKKSVKPEADVEGGASRQRAPTVLERIGKQEEVIQARIGLLREQWDQNVEAIRRQFKSDGLQDPVVNSDAVPPAVFSRCVAKAMARRLQQACGLSTEMTYSIDKDEIIMKIKADAGDLMTEADRTDYTLQTVNEVVPVPGMDGSWQERCEVWLGKACGQGQLRATEVDPVLVNSSEHANSTNESHHALVSEMSKFGYPKTKANSGIFGAVMDGVGALADATQNVAAVGGVGGGTRHRALGADWTEPSNKGDFFIAPYAQYQSLVKHSKQNEINDTNDHSKLQPMYRTYRGSGWDEGMGLFRDIDRLRLINSILARHLNLRAFADEYKYSSAPFALHSEQELAWLKENWATSWRVQALWPWINRLCGCRAQPLGRIRHYFGEKIAFYFGWLEFYTQMLLVPAVIGCIVFAVQVGAGAQDKAVGVSMIIFGGFISLWSTVFAELWKRKSAVYNLAWGTSTYVTQEQPRPAFQGRTRISPTTDERESFFKDEKSYIYGILGGVLVAGVMIVAVLVALGSIFVLKEKLSFAVYMSGDDKITYDPSHLVSHILPTPAGFYPTIAAALAGMKVLGMENTNTMYVNPETSLLPGPAIAGLINAIQIGIMNTLYRKVAIWLNNWENHRTDTDFENHLILKTFLFQFVNSYASFFYIAFVKEAATCVAPSLVLPKGRAACMSELQTQLLTIFGSKLVVGNLTEVLIPMLKVKLRERADKVEKGTQLKQAEREAKLNQYEDMESFEDYNEMVRAG